MVKKAIDIFGKKRLIFLNATIANE